MLIRKNACECNKCGKIDIVEMDVFAANVILMSEEFYLCKDCIAPIMDYITAGNGKGVIEEITDLHKQVPLDLRDFVECPTVENKEETPEPEENEPKDPGDFTFSIDWKKKEIKPGVPNDWDPKKEKAREYVSWSDYEVEKIVNLYRQGLSWVEIAKQLKFTVSQLYCLGQHIRNPKGILNKEKYERWAKQYPDVFVDNTKAKPTIEKFTVQQIEDILEKRGSGMAWLKISEEMNIPRITLTRIIEQLEQSKPGDRTYDLAVKYGYIVE